MMNLSLTGRRRWLAAVAGAGALMTASGVASAHDDGNHHRDHPGRVQHVLLLSVDGLHQSDLAWYVRTHPRSSMATLVRSGAQFTNAQTPVPSDSFPGLLGQLTGGNPRSTGVYYDDSWNPTLLPAGMTSCAGVPSGAEVNYSEAADVDPAALDAGQGLPGLPDAILAMTGDPNAVLNPAALPVDPATCAPIAPHQYLQVNTIFEVARRFGLRTAWSDKHPAYEIVNGPSGTGVQDLFTPEINSDAPTPGSASDWTKVNALTQRYDSYKVQAVLNEIHGYDHSGTQTVGTPAIFGMNFQSISTAQKLPVSDGQPGGYESDGVTPGPLLRGALDYVDRQIGALGAALASQRLLGTTALVLSAKHGQSPQEPQALTRIPDGPIIDALNAAWKAETGPGSDLVAFSLDDDAMLIWLNDRSPAATEFAKWFLLTHDGIGNDIGGAPKPYTASGLSKVYAGAGAARYFGAQVTDERRPDLYGIVQHGVVYTGGQGKIAEHGGADPQDRHVPLVVAGAGVRHGRDNRPVETTSIAPTILKLLGLPQRALQAVQIEHTRALPVTEGPAANRP
jgi:hypothetical protein